MSKKKANIEGENYPKLNPDPSTHLLLYPTSQKYMYRVGSNEIKGQGSHWLYAHSNTYELDHSIPCSCIGVKFHSGALYSLKSSISEVGISSIEENSSINTIQGLETKSVFYRSGLDEECLISMALVEPDKCCQVLDNLFTSLVLDNVEDAHSKSTRKVLSLLMDYSPKEISELLHCSKRTLERSFLKVTGFTMKQCQSMNRLEQILEFLYERKQEDIDWVDIAYRFGFSDQPHFIKFLRKQIGLTPNGYAHNRGFTIDVYGGVNSDKS